MKIAFLSDTHFGRRSDNEKFSNYIAQFYNDQFIPYLVDNKIDTIIQFGDLMDERKHIPVKGMKMIHDLLLQPLEDHGITMHTILGNHDTVLKHSNKLNSVEYIVKSFPKVILHKTLEELDIGGVKFAFVPWVNKENNPEFEYWLETSNADVVIGHFEFGGFQYMKNIVSLRGMSTKGFDVFKHVFSGHYHISSKVGNIMYLGTPYELTFADMDDEKGFHIFDTETYELEKIINPCKLYRRISYDDEKNNSDKFDFSEYENTYIKVFIKKRTNDIMYSKFIDDLYSCNAININIIEEDVKYDDIDASIEIEETFDIIKNTVNKIKNIPNKPILEKMTNLYQRAMETEA